MFAGHSVDGLLCINLRLLIKLLQLGRNLSLAHPYPLGCPDPANLCARRSRKSSLGPQLRPRERRRDWQKTSQICIGAEKEKKVHTHTQKRRSGAIKLARLLQHEIITAAGLTRLGEKEKTVWQGKKCCSLLLLMAATNYARGASLSVCYLFSNSSFRK